MAYMPLKEPGRIVLPTVCVPKPIGTWRSPTAAPDPEDDPPGVLEESWALAVLGPLCEGPTEVAANSVVVVFPTDMHKWEFNCAKMSPGQAYRISERH